MWLAVVVLVLVALTWRWVVETARGDGRAHLRSFPGPQGILGNVEALRKCGNNLSEILRVLMEEYYQKYGSPCIVWFGPWMSVHIFKAAQVEALLKGTTNIKKSRDYDQVRPWLGDGLLISEGEKWAGRRKLLTPAFHFDILRDFVEAMEAESRVLVAALLARAHAPVDVAPLISLCALDIICQTAMGYELGAQCEKESEYVKAIADFGVIAMWRSLRQWWWNDLLFFNLHPLGRRQRANITTLHSFTHNVIRQKISERAGASEVTEKRKRRAFLHLLLDLMDEGKLTLGDVREEVDTFMFEGHDTTATGIQWAVYLLGLHPEIQERARAEVNSVWGDTGVSAEALGELRYLECVLKESQRLYPSVPIMIRVLDTPISIGGGYTLPVGAKVNVPIMQLHRDPEEFPEPRRFDPDRFLPHNNALRHPFAFIPFSAGPRNCIGQRFAMMEEKVIMSHLLHSLQWTSLTPETDIKPAMQMVLKPTNGIPLRITPILHD